MNLEPEAIVEEILVRRSQWVDIGPLAPETPLQEVLDSLGLIVSVLDIESAFGRPVLDVAAVGSLVTVGDLIAAVRQGVMA